MSQKTITPFSKEEAFHIVSNAAFPDVLKRVEELARQYDDTASSLVRDAGGKVVTAAKASGAIEEVNEKLAAGFFKVSEVLYALDSYLKDELKVVELKPGKAAFNEPAYSDASKRVPLDPKKHFTAEHSSSLLMDDKDDSCVKIGDFSKEAVAATLKDIKNIATQSLARGRGFEGSSSLSYELKQIESLVGANKASSRGSGGYHRG